MLSTRQVGRVIAKSLGKSNSLNGKIFIEVLGLPINSSNVELILMHRPIQAYILNSYFVRQEYKYSHFSNFKAFIATMLVIHWCLLDICISSFQILMNSKHS